jgi:hypothetical protein
MDYRSLNINDFNTMHQSVVADEAIVEAGVANYEHFIRLGKAERGQMTLDGLRKVRQAVVSIFS